MVQYLRNSVVPGFPALGRDRNGVAYSQRLSVLCPGPPGAASQLGRTSGMGPGSLGFGGFLREVLDLQGVLLFVKVLGKLGPAWDRPCLTNYLSSLLPGCGLSCSTDQPVLPMVSILQVAEGGYRTQVPAALAAGEQDQLEPSGSPCGWVDVDRMDHSAMSTPDAGAFITVNEGADIFLAGCLDQAVHYLPASMSRILLSSTLPTSNREVFGT